MTAQTKAEVLAIIDTMADLARMRAVMAGMPLREWLETQHGDDPFLIDKIVERAALLPPLDEPPKPTLDELREAGKAGRLRVVIETPDAETMDAVAAQGVALEPLD
jgi:hypothetical protein